MEEARQISPTVLVRHRGIQVTLYPDEVLEETEFLTVAAGLDAIRDKKCDVDLHKMLEDMPAAAKRTPMRFYVAMATVEDMAKGWAIVSVLDRDPHTLQLNFLCTVSNTDKYIGTTLMLAVAKYAFQTNTSTVKWTTMEDARNFYANLGFEPIMIKNFAYEVPTIEFHEKMMLATHMSRIVTTKYTYQLSGHPVTRFTVCGSTVVYLVRDVFFLVLKEGSTALQEVLLNKEIKGRVQAMVPKPGSTSEILVGSVMMDVATVYSINIENGNVSELCAFGATVQISISSSPDDSTYYVCTGKQVWRNGADPIHNSQSVGFGKITVDGTHSYRIVGNAVEYAPFNSRGTRKTIVSKTPKTVYIADVAERRNGNLLVMTTFQVYEIETSLLTGESSEICLEDNCECIATFPRPMTEDRESVNGSVNKAMCVIPQTQNVLILTSDLGQRNIFKMVALVYRYYQNSTREYTYPHTLILESTCLFKENRFDHNIKDACYDYEFLQRILVAASKRHMKVEIWTHSEAVIRKVLLKFFERAFGLEDVVDDALVSTYVTVRKYDEKYVQRVVYGMSRQAGTRRVVWVLRMDEGDIASLTPILKPESLTNFVLLGVGGGPRLPEFTRQYELILREMYGLTIVDEDVNVYLEDHGHDKKIEAEEVE